MAYFFNVVSISGTVKSKDRINRELWTENDLEVSGNGVI
jgi:hypothetical protein